QISLLEATKFASLPGYGIQAVVEEQNMLVGTRKLMEEHHIPIESNMVQAMEKLEANGKTAMLIACNQQLVGVIAVADTVKETSKQAIARMHSSGLDVMMLTGDNELTAD